MWPKYRDRFGFSHIREQKLTACFLSYLDVSKLKTLVRSEDSVTLVDGKSVVLSQECKKHSKRIAFRAAMDVAVTL